MMRHLQRVLVALFAVLSVAEAYAVDYEYVPLVREGVKWQCRYQRCEKFDEVEYRKFTLEMKGDTVINGKVYKPWHYYSGAAIDPAHDTVAIYVREENKVVYGYYEQEYCSICVGWSWGDTLQRPREEFVLYDFNDYEKFYVDLVTPLINSSEPYVGDDGDSVYVFRYLGTDTIKVGNSFRKRHAFQLFKSTTYIVEGVGYGGCKPEGTISFGAWPYYPLEYYSLRALESGSDCEGYWLDRVIENGQVVYPLPNDPSVGVTEVTSDGDRWSDDPRFYNLMGQPVENPTQGIYIHRGKKIIVR